MKKYESPAFHWKGHVVPMNNEQIARLSDAELEACLKENGYWERSKLYRVNENYILREIAGEHVLIPTGDLPGNVMITMNGTCAFLWEQMKEPKTVDDLVFAARQHFDDPNGELEAHIHEFVEYRVKTGHIWEVE